ncbi:hypothetical protein GF420_02220 [candidate division GN15 bacterium]|nr:hypothetical protein [candidate division GN15 bacterium]
MSRQQTLTELESVLESFLDRVVAVKEQRLEVLDGINRLDDIARRIDRGDELTDQIGNWFAEHNRWLSEGTLRQADTTRISRILDQIGSRLEKAEETTPAMTKIAAEIERWQRQAGGEKKIVLTRGPETAPKSDTERPGSLARFADQLQRLTARFDDLAGSSQHVLSALDDALTSAERQQNKDALILSALIIYSLKQENYKVEPYVKRLRAAERRIQGGRTDA